MFKRRLSAALFLFDCQSQQDAKTAIAGQHLEVKELVYESLIKVETTARQLSRIQSRRASTKQPAYVIYTSGTTGKPKGVVVSQGAIANTLAWRARMTPLSTKDHMLMPLSHQFDAGLGMMLFAISQGAMLTWPDTDRIADLDYVVDRLKQDLITVVTGVPTWIDLIAAHREFAGCESLRHIWIGGESMPEGLPRMIRRSSDAQVWNCYGPTEAAVEATVYRVDDVYSPRRIPTGYPADHTEVWILDDKTPASTRYRRRTDCFNGRRIGRRLFGGSTTNT